MISLRNLPSLFREPLIQFLLLGGAIVLGKGLLPGGREPDIVVTAEIVGAMVEEWRNDPERAGRKIEPVALARAYLEDELLIREARSRGLLESPSVRTALVQEMRALLEPVLRAPTVEELQAYRAENAETYQFPPEISFSHVSYPPGIDPPRDVLSRLRRGERPPPPPRPVRLPDPLPPTYRTQLDRILGARASAAVFDAEKETWTGPIVSTRGTHFVFVQERTTERDIPFEQIRPTLEANWREARKRDALEEALRKMAEDYRIQLPPEFESARP